MKVSGNLRLYLAGNLSADTAVKSLGQFVFADDVVAHSFCPTDGSRSTSPQGETNQSLNVLLFHVNALARHAPAVHIGRIRLLTDIGHCNRRYWDGGGEMEIGR